jgi:hypothetical protein
VENSKKKILTAEELALKKTENSRKRKSLANAKLEEEVTSFLLSTDRMSLMFSFNPK